MKNKEFQKSVYGTVLKDISTLAHLSTNEYEIETDFGPTRGGQTKVTGLKIAYIRQAM
jgi:hypothetical protein